jgi:hypothetical protein
MGILFVVALLGALPGLGLGFLVVAAMRRIAP